MTLTAQVILNATVALEVVGTQGSMRCKVVLLRGLTGHDTDDDFATRSQDCLAFQLGSLWEGGELREHRRRCIDSITA